MKVYAIGDLHLSLSTPKPMDIFGMQWKDHWEKIRCDWISKVGEEDIVLIPGDISWAMKFEDAKQDLEVICKLPGNKVLLKGNHDYWWSSLSKLEGFLYNKTYVVQNNCVVCGDYVILGSRGWTFPNDRATAQDKAIYDREILRLKLSADNAIKHNDKVKIAMMHFPPFNEQHESSEVTDILARSGVSYAVYGHLHDAGLKFAFDGNIDGVEYSLVSCDYLDFKLKRII